MTKTNIKANHIKIENLYKSMFSEIKKTSLNLSDEKVEIIHLDDKNHLMKALRIFKRYAKKMAKNLKRYSSHGKD
jgi:maleate cis-trans isomerase